MSRFRWAFNCRSWNPGEDEWKMAISLVSCSERDRISKFLFLEDKKRALIGRLAIRAAIVKGLRVPWERIELSRTDKGKPCFTEKFTSSNPHSAGFNFNISHQGDFVVLATEEGCQVGVDVMKIEAPHSGKTLDEFFHSMRNLFTQKEWGVINSPLDPNYKLQNFYRFWTLKESYLKATGQGISLDLRFLEFSTVENVSREIGTVNTLVSLLQIPQIDWTFEESFIDSLHLVCVATNMSRRLPMPTRFTILDIGTLFEFS